jgi:hypothetical protein
MQVVEVLSGKVPEELLEQRASTGILQLARRSIAKWEAGKLQACTCV